MLQFSFSLRSSPCTPLTHALSGWLQKKTQQTLSKKTAESQGTQNSLKCNLPDSRGFSIFSSQQLCNFHDCGSADLSRNSPLCLEIPLTTYPGIYANLRDSQNRLHLTFSEGSQLPPHWGHWKKTDCKRFMSLYWAGPSSQQVSGYTTTTHRTRWSQNTAPHCHYFKRHSCRNRALSFPLSHTQSPHPTPFLSQALTGLCTFAQMWTQLVDRKQLLLSEMLLFPLLCSS